MGSSGSLTTSQHACLSLRDSTRPRGIVLTFLSWEGYNESKPSNPRPSPLCEKTYEVAAMAGDGNHEYVTSKTRTEWTFWGLSEKGSCYASQPSSRPDRQPSQPSQIPHPSRPSQVSKQRPLSPHPSAAHAPLVLICNTFRDET